MESLRQKQSRFTRYVGLLIEFAYQNGYELTHGDGFRDPRVFGTIGERKGYGHPKSAHKNRLAQDFNLFKDGKWLQDTESFRPLGEYWESLAADCKWGGDFEDGNHFSLEHNGIM